MSAARFLVSGRVQGVFFRTSTKQEALALGLHGSARNLPDGRVEVIVGGDAAAIDTLAQWLQHGPPMADVEAVQRSAWDGEVSTGFTTA
ncbi:acylphosphatase [Pseudoxanthomonas sp. GM95]|uniref:acylphosphatase n=1 Tax=Pseudoxanthomonas sp. GM95 TaxID=1881043 RepID=UPI0008BD5589|nr:acylphosphatase [Pseudoxanthomonas sp. GM95]SEK60571.1 acylphosphatase [Pseudoxanthomonas sp. GM95]